MTPQIDTARLVLNGVFFAAVLIATRPALAVVPGTTLAGKTQRGSVVGALRGVVVSHTDEKGRVFTVLFDFEQGQRVREYRYRDTPIGNGGG